jgi:1-acyl-sn-glycerol-3-phosphate acyltransferase
MMNRDRIGKYSLGYDVLRVYARVMHYLYYGRVRVQGRENIPKGKPLIFAPNHQNALMDALAVLFTYPRQMVFLARSDIFRKGLFSRMLTFLKMLPIYRIRDGYSALQSNIEIFEKTVELLQECTPLVILPEGNHAGWRRLRPLKKGIARIAFQAEESHNFSLGIQIVPVGLDYSRYERSGAELLIRYGSPIEVSAFADLYRENPARATNELLKELSGRLAHLMINIQPHEHYGMVDVLRKSYAYSVLRENCQRPTPWNRHDAEMETVKRLEKWLTGSPDPNVVEKLRRTATRYRVTLKRHKLQFRNPEEGKWPWWKIIGQGLLFLVTLPLFVYGFVNNILPVIVPKVVVKRVKDVQFRSTFKFGMAIVTVPIFYAVQTLFFGLLAPLPPPFTLWYLLSLPISGMIALRYRLFFRRFLTRIRFRLLALTRPSDFRELLNIRAEIGEIMGKWVFPR